MPNLKLLKYVKKNALTVPPAKTLIFKSNQLYSVSQEVLPSVKLGSKNLSYFPCRSSSIRVLDQTVTMFVLSSIREKEK